MGMLLDEVRFNRDALRFGFAVGKVRVLESRMLDKAAFERLLDAPSFTEQKRLLSETPYGRYIENAWTAEEVEAGLERALDAFYRFLDEAELPATVSRFFRVRYDFANLKAAAKARSLGVPLDGLLVGHGTVPLEQFAGELTDLPEPLANVAEKLERADGSEVDIDATVDAALFAELKRLARETRSPFLREIATLLVDIANAKTLVRARRAGLAMARVEPLVIEGGSVSRDELLKIAESPSAELADALARLPRFKGIEPEALADASVLDPATDAVLMGVLRRGRRGPVGPEPVIAYVFARESEVAALRVLLLGKLGGIDTETLRTRFRATYR